MIATPKLILASTSPRRKILMRKAGYHYRIVASHVSERAPQKMKPAALVRYLAFKKAKSVSKNHPTSVVVGADTLVFLDGQAIGKPRDGHHARRMLQKLSGRWQRVYTGVAVVWEGGGRSLTQAAVSYVKFRRLTSTDIEKAAHRHLDKAGAYAVQERGDGFIAKIQGDYDNVVGLPMRVVKRLLRGCAQTLTKSLGHKINFQR